MVTLVAVATGACGDDGSAATGPVTTADPSTELARAGGYRLTRPPIVVVERVRGENRFSVWFRLNKRLPTRCSPLCQQDRRETPPRIRAAVTLSGGGTDSDQAGVVGVGSRRDRHCYQQDVSDYPADSPLANAVPGDTVTVRLKIHDVKRALKQRVQMIEPLPREPTRVGAEYERALNCGTGRDRD